MSPVSREYKNKGTNKDNHSGCTANDENETKRSLGPAVNGFALAQAPAEKGWSQALVYAQMGKVSTRQPDCC